MKKILRTTGALLLSSALFTPVAQAYLTVTGNGTSPATANGTTFVVTPTAASFYRPTGEYFFGLIQGGGNGAISYGNYRTADVSPVLTAIGTDAAISNLNVDQLAVVPYSGDVTSPTIVAAITATGAATGTATQLQAITKTVTTAVASGALLGTTAVATTGIRKLTASRESGTVGTNGNDLVFAAVKVAGAAAGTGFGAGAAAGSLGTDTDGFTAALLGRDATTGAPTFVAFGGSDATHAQAFDLTKSGSYFIAGATNTFLTTCSVASRSSALAPAPAMYYDSILNRLYVGTSIAVGPSTAGVINGGLAGAISIGIYPVTKTANSVTIGAQLAPFTSYANIQNDGTNPIAVIANNSATIGVAASAMRLRTMHTSTGFCYLLVNGGTTSSTGTGQGVDFIATASGASVWAIPLVGPSGAAGIVGCPADVRTADYLTQAGGAAGSFILSTSPAAIVGGGSLSTIVTPTAFTITDMYVDNDAVYVAAGAALAVSGTNEAGIWKSQAIFDEFGKIDHWTDWQKVAPNDLGGATAGGAASDGADGSVNFVAVDGYTGHIWATNQTSQKTKVTQWTLPTGAATSQPQLAAAVNAAMPNGLCYSVLDLNNSTSGWGGTIPARITVFGGQEVVSFAVTGSSSTSIASLNGLYNKPCQSLNNNVYDYTNTLTFFTSSLPTGAGAVISLGFTGWNAANQGFILAGCAGTATTAPALYALTINGTQGLSVSSLYTTDLTAGSWVQIPNVAGMPVKIASMGGGLHVLTRTATQDRVYSCAAQATAALLNSSFVVTASSGVAPVTAGQSDLTAVEQIYDLIISVSATNTQPATGNEQLLILTNDGIYTTSSSIGMQSAAITQQNAGWTRIAAPTTNGFLTNYIVAPAYSRNPETFWFGNWAANPESSNVYNQYIWYQMNRYSFLTAGAGNSTLAQGYSYAEVPSNTVTYNGATSFAQTTAPSVYATFPVNARLLYDDGARRYFVQKNPSNDGGYQVLVLPYNLYDYNITTNGKATMSDAVVSSASTVYWMSLAGDTGRLLMSTDKGVVALQ